MECLLSLSLARSSSPSIRTRARVPTAGIEDEVEDEHEKAKDREILRRLLKYADRVYHLSRSTASVRDARVKPRIPVGLVINSLLIMLWTRLGSFNALEEERPGRYWRRWLGGDLRSADNLGAVAAVIQVDDVREVLRQHYALRRRKKTLKPIAPGLWPLIFDGHESNSSFLRCCPDCLQRTVHTKHGDRIQYYHRYVLALLLHADGVLLMDVEPQRPGEDEMAPARRLLARALANCPRAFNLVVGDALYLHPDFCRLALDHHKDFLAVLKNENRDLLVDVRSLIPQVQPVAHHEGRTESLWWDIEGFTSWTQLGHPVRVARSVETTTVRRQRTKKDEDHTVEWVWATSLPVEKASTQTVVHIGHRRWSIENEAFNELVNQWHANHIYKHDLNAMVAIWLLLCLTYNLFHVFIARNLKPQLRDGHAQRHWASLIRAEFYSRLVPGLHARPP